MLAYKPHVARGRKQKRRRDDQGSQGPTAGSDSESESGELSAGMHPQQHPHHRDPRGRPDLMLTNEQALMYNPRAKDPYQETSLTRGRAKPGRPRTSTPAPRKPSGSISEFAHQHAATGAHAVAPARTGRKVHIIFH